MNPSLKLNFNTFFIELINFLHFHDTIQYGKNTSQNINGIPSTYLKRQCLSMTDDANKQ